MWTTPKTQAVGDPVIAADWNTHVRDNEQYLKGNAGTITFGDRANFSNDASLGIYLTGTITVWESDGGDYISYERAPNLYRIFVGSLEKARIDTDGLHSHDGTTLMRVQRHPYSNNRHVESGNASVANNGGTSSPTFTNAYASNPAVPISENRQPGNVYVSALSTTGFTVTNAFGGDASSTTVYWIAEGQD